MSARDWILQFTLGGLFGALGQSMRVVVGLKKLNDQALQAGKQFGELFSPGALLVSLFMGFVAGVLGTLSQDMNLQAVTRENVLVLIGIGYSGADFIEGFMKKRLAGAPGPAAPRPVGQARAEAGGEAAAPAAAAQPPGQARAGEAPAAEASPAAAAEPDHQPPPVG